MAVMTRFGKFLTVLGCAAFVSVCHAQSPAAPALTPADGTFKIANFRFNTGEVLPDFHIHYLTVGTLRRDAAGHALNAVLLLHGTGGQGSSFTKGEFPQILISPGGLLDPAKYFVIMPDGIGHGSSSKPSDGLRMHFPKYDYDDMVKAEHALVTDGLHIDHLRLILGTSMGCMQAFMWGEMWPDITPALMPLACNARPIVGRNRLWREMGILAIKSDPAWMGGDYKSEPIAGLTADAMALVLAGSAPLRMQKDLPTPDAADKRAAESLARQVSSLDANNAIYQLESSRDYDPNGKLEAITAHVMWVNSTDDFVNPPELGLVEKDVRRIKHGRFVLIQATADTNGHGTHSMPSVWGNHLAELLKDTERQNP